MGLLLSHSLAHRPSDLHIKPAQCKYNLHILPAHLICTSALHILPAHRTCKSYLPTCTSNLLIGPAHPTCTSDLQSYLYIGPAHPIPVHRTCTSYLHIGSDLHIGPAPRTHLITIIIVPAHFDQHYIYSMIDIECVHIYKRGGLVEVGTANRDMRISDTANLVHVDRVALYSYAAW